ncbi:MarR family transcriptional regulator [Rhizobium lemnae]|uniref:MarR family winged helix-turn-helix transcriptional regulator n=1 Tax=Rhizobium lemnae TaxID=1214924 RepID=A0ABV8ECI2_9HYPH|nr:MarR family transcriptional regulator [Rhizobium lemnae]MCJ8507055.1 MarR family transcriptional regulator [Rhizobium lemnae]
MVRKAAEKVKAETQEPETPSADAHLTRFVGYDLKRLLNLVQSDLTRVLVPFNLRIISYSVLSVVVRCPGINQTRLAEALKLERSNLVQIVDELSTRRLLTRNPIENNRRSHALLATPEGMALIEAVDLEVIAHEEKLFSDLSPAELTMLRQLLLRARQSIELRMVDEAD